MKEHEDNPDFSVMVQKESQKDINKFIRDDNAFLNLILVYVGSTVFYLAIYKLFIA
jgi:hypothetical protein